MCVKELLTITMLVCAIVVTLLGVAVGRPSSFNISYDPISQEDREFLRTLPTHRSSYPPGFKEAYLSEDGKIVYGPRPSGAYIKVIGTPGASIGAVNHVASEVHKMLRNAPRLIFNNLVQKDAGVGIFREHEKVTIFPEYAKLRDTPECRGRCDGDCSVTCSSDGRKWDTIAGAGGPLAAVLEKNVMCAHDDPYRKRHNGAVHEFGHTVNFYGFDMNLLKSNQDAYENAKARALWSLSSYAMSGSTEYFAEATGAFFGVNLYTSTGGMNECYGPDQYCRTEMEVRRRIQGIDPTLYSILVFVYTNNRPQLPSGLTMCPQSGDLVG